MTRRRWWGVGLCGAAAVIGLFWAKAPVPRGPLEAYGAVCIATARARAGAAVYDLDEDAVPKLLAPDARAQLPAASVVLARGEWVEAQPIATGGWCEVEGVQPPTSDSRLALSGGGLYAKTSALAPLSVRLLAAGDRRQPPRGERAMRGVTLQNAFATKYLEVSGVALGRDGATATAVHRHWVRAPEALGYSLYTIDHGRPHWLFGRVLWRFLWCDPAVRIVQGSRGRSHASLVAFQPPLWLLTFSWEGQGQAVRAPLWEIAGTALRVILWSFRRWLVLAALVTGIAIGRGHLQRYRTDGEVGDERG